jgi:hypothetical protein
MNPLRTISDEAKYVRLDALMAWWPYAEGSLRASIETLLEEAKQEGWSETQERELLRYAEATWPARRAVQRFAMAHPDMLWSAFIVRCLPTTQVLLQRLSEAAGHQKVSELMRLPQADFALHEPQRVEIELLLPQVYALLWRDHRSEMDSFLHEAEQERVELQASLHGEVAAGAMSAYEHAMMYGERPEFPQH